MASLTGSSIASSYTSLLKLNGNTDTLVDGDGSNAIQVVDGAGTGSALYLNKDRLGIGGQPTYTLQVKTPDGNAEAFGVEDNSSGRIFTHGVSGDAYYLKDKTANATRFYMNYQGKGTFYNEFTFAGDVLAAEYIKHEGDTDTNIRFQTDHIDLTTANTLALRVDSSQNVGIGHSAPATTMHVVTTDGITVSDTATDNTNPTTADGTTDKHLTIQRSAIRSHAPTNANSNLNIGMKGGNDSGAGAIIFQTGNTETERMRIQKDGNVSIGISNPTSGQNWSQFLQINHTTNCALVLTETDGTQTCDVATNGAGMFIDIAGHSDATNNNINFRTEETNSSYSPTTRMTITYYGAILPGADDTQDLGSSSLRFDDVFATNGTIQTSDERLKDNITDSSLGLDFVNALRPVKYQWKDYTYDVEKEKAVEAKEAVYETVVVQEAVEAKEAVMGKRQKTVSKEVEKTKTEIVEEDGKYVQKEVSYTETVEEPQYEEVNLYDEDGEVIGSHKIPVMEEYEVEPAIEAVKEITEERLVSEAIEAKDAVMETKEKTFARTHFGLIAQEVEQVLKDSSLTNNDFAGLIYDEDADRYGMRYHELIAPLIKAIQELSKKVTDLENK